MSTSGLGIRNPENPEKVDCQLLCRFPPRRQVGSPATMVAASSRIRQESACGHPAGKHTSEGGPMRPSQSHAEIAILHHQVGGSSRDQALKQRCTGPRALLMGLQATVGQNVARALLDTAEAPASF